MSLDQSTHSNENVHQRSYVSFRSAAVSVQLRKSLEGAHHAVSLTWGDRRDPDRDILHQLGRGAAGAAGEHWSEVLVLHHADYHLDSIGHHRLKLKACDRMARLLEGCRHCSRRARDQGASLQSQSHTAGVRLVQDARRNRLESNVRANLPSQPTCFVGRGGETGLDQRDPIGRKELDHGLRRHPTRSRPERRRYHRGCAVAVDPVGRDSRFIGKRTPGGVPSGHAQRAGRFLRERIVRHRHLTGTDHSRRALLGHEDAQHRNAARQRARRGMDGTDHFGSRCHQGRSEDRDHCVDFITARQHPDGSAIGIALRLGEHVDRIGRRSRGREKSRQVAAHLGRQRRDNEAARLTCVCAEDRRAPRVGEDCDAIAGRQRLAPEQQGGVEEFGERVGPYDPGLLEERLDCHI